MYPFDNDPEPTDEEYADIIQECREQPSMYELDRMFEWWEKQRLK